MEYRLCIRSKLSLRDVALASAILIVGAAVLQPVIADARSTAPGSMSLARKGALAASLYAEGAELAVPNLAVCLQEGAWTTADGGCRDNASGLVWGTNFYEAIGRHATNPYFPNFYQAQEYCANSTEAGFDDWRMPTRDEMVMAARNEARNYIFLYGTDNFDFSSTTRANKWVYTVNLWTGAVYEALIKSSGKNSTYTQVDVRCVRSASPATGSLWRDR